MVYCERFIASAIAFPFRGGQMLCFGAYNTCAANKHTGHLHPRGKVRGTSTLPLATNPSRPLTCGCHDVTALHYPSAANHVILLPYSFGRMLCVPTCGCQDAAATM